MISQHINFIFFFVDTSISHRRSVAVDIAVDAVVSLRIKMSSSRIYLIAICRSTASRRRNRIRSSVAVIVVVIIIVATVVIVAGRDRNRVLNGCWWCVDVCDMTSGAAVVGTVTVKTVRAALYLRFLVAGRIGTTF